MAIDVDAALDAIAVAEVRERAYEPGDLDGVRLVVTATGIVDVDASVAADATSRGIWVNAADQTNDCSFILPAIARDGSVSVAVSTDGTAPAVASWLARPHRRRGARRRCSPHRVGRRRTPPRDPRPRRVDRGTRLARRDRATPPPVIAQAPGYCGGDVLAETRGTG
ncbi:MAG: NAD(P)-dependent oxidoreductase [Ilumatobacteraceae bacterium]